MNSKYKKKENRKIIAIIIAVLTLIVAIAGATYAFFSATIASGNYITGTTGLDRTALTLEITQVSSGNDRLIPQNDDSIQGAVSGTTGNGTCIDSNNNTVCKAYSIKITNNSSVKMNVTGTLTLTAPDMPNLKWAKGSSAVSGFPDSSSGPFYSTFNTFTTNVSSTTQTTSLANDVLQPSGYTGDSKTYYIAIWISETSSAQTDCNSFNGTVNFSAYIEDENGNNIQGVTSAFRG